jgi:dephospho-CoA kinase
MKLPLMTKAVYVLTGSSAAGKTTLLKHIRARLPSDIALIHVDDEAIYEANYWFKAIAQRETALTILDLSLRPTEIIAAAKRYGIALLSIVLIDCDHAERRRRLLEERKQAELDTLDIYAWAAYLRGQADALALEIIDTSTATLGESASILYDSIQRFSEVIAVDTQDETTSP